MNRIALLVGTVFGVLLVLAQFTEYDVIHEGLLLHNARIYLVMGTTMLLSLPLLWMMERMRWKSPLGGKLSLYRAKIERKHIYGGVLFGVGWAVSGTCPAVSAAMFGSGHLMGLVVMVGLLIGTLLRDIQSR